MAKLPYVTRDDLPEDRRGVYDRIRETRGEVDNVFRLLLNNPDAAEVITAVGEYVRYRSPLPGNVRELAILSVAREMNCEYEWAQHAPIARREGVSEHTLDAIRSGRAPMGVPAKDGVYVQGVKELLRDGALSDATYSAIEHLLGPSGMLDYLALVGYYSMLARLTEVTETDLDPPADTKVVDALPRE